MINTITLPPFKKMCVTIGNLPSSFVESMSYYEALCWMYNYLDKTVIPAINTEGEAITELQTAFTTLKTYVDNYFENLDVQEEINNKLDAMAEAGTLTDIIAQYLGLAGVLAYNTVADMKAAENLVNGSTAKTLGFYSLNDKGGASYKIRNIINTDIVDEMTIISLYDENLIAELIIEDTMNVNQFGASENQANNSSFISKAIEKCSTIILNDEQYNTSSTILINKPIKIIGNNNTRSLLYPALYSETANPIIQISSTTGVILENFNIKSNYTSGSSVTTNGIYCGDNTYHLTFRNIQISNCKNGILVGQTWNMLFENCIFDTCDNGFNSSGTVTSTSFISCVVYNSHFGWYIRGGFVYSGFYSCGVDHTDIGIRSEGAGSIDTYNFGAEDYQRVYSIASNANGIRLNAHNTFFYPSERVTGDVLFQGNECIFYDTSFPDNTNVSSSVAVRYLNCTNVPATSNTILNTYPLGYLDKQTNGVYGYLKGYKTQANGSTVTLTRKSGQQTMLINGNLIITDGSKVINVLIGSRNSNHKVENVDAELVSVTFNNYDMTITFNKEVDVDFNIKFRGYE